ncbi:MAG: hypothetical protein I8H67_13595 [Comamonadaceae bacterium]|nr:hypothetical protein [Comamonadaceae bacterium]
MTAPFAGQLPGSAGNGAIRVWLKSAAYTTRVLLSADGADPWVNAAQYLAYFSQAHALLKPDVAVVEVGDLYDSWSQRHGGLAGSLGNRRRPATALRKLLEPEGAKAVLAEVIVAVLAYLRGQTPLVLAMPSPRHWLHHANRLAGLPETALDPDTVEDGAMYLADLIRSVSTLPISGLLLEERPGDSAFGPVDLERYRSVINVARHYRWSLASRLPSGIQMPADAMAGFDAVIAKPGVYAGALPLGLDISEAFATGEALPALGAGQFHFAQIVPGQRPEAVLDTVARLRAARA